MKRIPTCRRLPQQLLRYSLFAILPGSCIHAGRDADAGITGLRAEIREARAALIDVQTNLRAGRDVNQNDNWTLRLLGLGVLLLGLSYPVGKIVWLAMAGVGRRASALRGIASRPSPDAGDLMILRDRTTRC